MNIDGKGERESESHDEDNRTQGGVLGDRKTSFQGSDLKVDGAIKDGKEGVANVLQGPGFPQVQQQQSQGSAVCWERFLHVRTIRVLLVESDDSTRHVVSALLRNCNYEVIEAANGLQAWKILEDLSNHIDIVLSEVVMPCVSGVALLCKIMSHKTRKNVPVIMMSSHDSMVLVFKCLSKGAVDFFLKPIRKNELKNLWQHVWRRCHSSSGSRSGSVSGTQTQKSIKSKTSEKRDNSRSHDGENNGNNGLNIGEESDDGSATQSSWTKQAVEVDSSPAMSPIDQVAECPDSTCAQVIRLNNENSGYRSLDIAVRGGCEQSQPDIVAEGKNLVTAVPRNLESESKNPKPSAELNFLSSWECDMSIKQVVKVQLNPTGECLNSKHKGGITKTSIPLTDSKESGCTRAVTSLFDINKNAADDSKEPNTELSLKRLRGVHDTGGPVQDDRCILRRSELSAFSRYNNTSSNVFKAPHGIKGSSSIIDNSVELAKQDSVGDMQPHSTEYLVHRSSNRVSNNIDIGSTTNNLRSHPSIAKDKSETTSTVDGLNPSAFRPLENDPRYPQSQVNELEAQRTHFYNYHHHHNRNFHDLENNQDDPRLKKLAEDAPQCGSTNVLGRPLEGNDRNYRDRSASGSNHGSNGPNRSSTAINAAGTNTESGFGGDASGSGSGTGAEEYKLAPREAALNKFRQKRKERSFKKRVRYENRRKLAEQRPRVRGQFVKKTGTDSSNRSSNE